MNRERLVLVTGATGYIGSALVPHLVANGFRVRTLDTQYFGNAIAHLTEVEFVQGDITSRIDCERAVKGVTDVCHLAGIVTDELVDLNVRKGWAVNVGGTKVLLDAAADALVSRFIYASSSSVYGLAAARGIPDESTIPEPQTEYARQKLAAEELVLAARDFDCVTAVRQATACGPAPRLRLDVAGNIFSRQAYFEGVLTPYGGTQYRSNVHIDDVARFYELLLTAPVSKLNRHPWNLTMGNMTIGDIAQEVANAYFDWSGKSVVIETKDVPDARSYRLNGEKIRSELGFQTHKTMRDAAIDNFEWFKKSGLDPNDDIYGNTKRMRELMLREV